MNVIMHFTLSQYKYKIRLLLNSEIKLLEKLFNIYNLCKYFVMQGKCKLPFTLTIKIKQKLAS